MRSCLVLTDCPVLFKVNSFKTENVIKIKTAWPDIKASLIKTIDLLAEFGINGQNLSSNNSIIPIAYYFIKRGNINRKNKQEIKYYIYHSLLNNLYSGQGDTVLSNLRNTLRKKDSKNGGFILKNQNFVFDQMLNSKLPANKTLSITNSDIDEFLETKKSYTSFLILTLLYPHFRFNQITFHQDHIYPSASFKFKELHNLGLSVDEIIHWQDIKDKLPNLQLMEGRENESKNSQPIIKWLHGNDNNGNPNVSDVKYFMKSNYIPEKLNLELINFENFYKKREEKIRKELHRKLKVV